MDSLRLAEFRSASTAVRLQYYRPNFNPLTLISSAKIGRQSFWWTGRVIMDISFCACLGLGQRRLQLVDCTMVLIHRRTLLRMSTDAVGQSVEVLQACSVHSAVGVFRGPNIREATTELCHRHLSNLRRLNTSHGSRRLLCHNMLQMTCVCVCAVSYTHLTLPTRFAV